jgi:hypothetical protein
MNPPRTPREPERTRPDAPAGAERPQQKPEDPRSEEPGFVDEPDLPAGEPSGAPTRHTKAPLPSKRGDEPMTGAQKSYLKTLCEQAHQPFDDNLTKAQASRRIDELHRLTRLGAAPSVGRDVAAHGGARR